MTQLFILGQDEFVEYPNILSQESRGKPKFKLLVFILLTIFSLGFVGYFLIPKLAPFIPFLRKVGIKSQVQPKLIREKIKNKIDTVNHPDLFRAEIEYNLEDNTVTLIEKRTVKGDTPVLSPTPPAADQTKFIYKIELVSNKDELLYFGYRAIPKEILLIENNRFRLAILVPYRKDAIVRIYNSSQKIVWTTKII